MRAALQAHPGAASGCGGAEAEGPVGSRASLQDLRPAGVPAAAADPRLRVRSWARQPDRGLCKSGIAAPPIRVGPGAIPANGGAGGRGSRGPGSPVPLPGPRSLGWSRPRGGACAFLQFPSPLGSSAWSKRFYKYTEHTGMSTVKTFFVMSKSFSRAAKGKFPWFSALFFPRVVSLMGAFTREHVTFPECVCFSFRFL